MSTLLLFKGTFLRSGVNIQTCFTLQRKSRLGVPEMSSRPWSAAMLRLLHERGLDAIDLVGHAGVKRGPTISSIINSPASPKVGTLQQIARALQIADQIKNGARAKGPVELWEFFVSEDQAETLKKRAAATAAIVGEPTLTEDDKRDLEFGRRIKAMMEAEKTPAAVPPQIVSRKKR